MPRKVSDEGEPVTMELCGQQLRVSKPNKPYFPEPGFTKLDLVNYYIECEQAVVRHLRERPTVMKRWVEGVAGEPFFQKRVPAGAPGWLQTATVKFPSGRSARELVPNDVAHLVWGANLGVIDWNPWPVRRADLDRPDELRIDLDPGPGVEFAQVRRVALCVQEVLDAHGLSGYPKTSGSRGIHVFVRVVPEQDFSEVRRAALALAREVERRMPGQATSKWWKEEREGVFIDYNQNARDRTVASAYSVRAVADARVSCPLAWDEVADVEPEELRLDTVPARLRERGDPSATIDEKPGSLAALLELAARDEREGLGDAPWPPHFRKQAGEPRRVQPSRAKVAMSLPLSPPLAPELALSRKALPEGEDYVYEVKLDGFRCIAFVDGKEVFLQSRNGRPLHRYFPELRFPPGRYVLDGEIVVRTRSGTPHRGGQAGDGQVREDFDALGQRIHPAASRIELLSRQTPAIYVVFDLLAREDESLLERPFCERREGLERLLEELGVSSRGDGERAAEGSTQAYPIEPMRSVGSAREAEVWLRDAEGVIAKERSAPYLPGERKGMVKIKRVRTIDAVVVGWRPGKHEGTVGALILALYDGERLRVVGHCSGLTAKAKRELVQTLAPYETGERGSADPSRWSADRDLEWVALRPELVVEIDFDHVSAGRIRHGAKLRRWREDKAPRECTFEQLAG